MGRVRGPGGRSSRSASSSANDTPGSAFLTRSQSARIRATVASFSSEYDAYSSRHTASCSSYSALTTGRSCRNRSNAV